VDRRVSPVFARTVLEEGFVEGGVGDQALQATVLVLRRAFELLRVVGRSAATAD
jgi:hypothetical protein